MPRICHATHVRDCAKGEAENHSVKWVHDVFDAACPVAVCHAFAPPLLGEEAGPVDRVVAEGHRGGIA